MYYLCVSVWLFVVRGLMLGCVCVPVYKDKLSGFWVWIWNSWLSP